MNFFTAQEDNFLLRQPGTGEWFLKSATFQNWVSGDGETLWTPGIPGAGKTILASIIIDELRRNFEHSPGVRIAGAYCSYRDQQAQTLFNMLSGLWRQVIDQDAAHSNDIQELYRRHRDSKRQPSLNDLMRIFGNEVQKHSRLFVVIDALDEMPDSMCSEFIKRIRSLSPKLNLLVTSRKLESIAELFAGRPTFPIGAQNEDLITFIEARIAREPKLSKVMKQFPGLQKDTVATILEKSENMFVV